MQTAPQQAQAQPLERALVFVKQQQAQTPANPASSPSSTMVLPTMNVLKILHLLTLGYGVLLR